MWAGFSWASAAWAQQPQVIVPPTTDSPGVVFGGDTSTGEGIVVGGDTTGFVIVGSDGRAG